VKAAGIRQFGVPVELLELPAPRALRPDEALIDVRAAGVGNWDERFPLPHAAQALDRARHGAHGTAIVLWPGDPA
jgi:hypothetical protein